MDSDIVQKVRAIAAELLVRGTRPGHVGAGTQQRSEELRRNLLELHNAEKTYNTTTEFFKSEAYEEGENRLSRLIPDNDRQPVRMPLPNTTKGEIYDAMIQHLMAAVWGKASFSPDQRERAIQSAAQELPKLCDRLQALTGQEESPNADNNAWKQARDADSKITIADQMMLLFKRDDSIVDRKNLSGEVAKILGCSSQAVRHADNASWKYYQAEQARRKELRQSLKGKNSPQYRNGQRLAKSDDEDTDD